MFTGQDLIDNIGRLIADIHDGTWVWDEAGEVHPAIAWMFNQLPDSDGQGRKDVRKGDWLVTTQGEWTGRRALVDAFELLPGMWATIDDTGKVVRGCRPVHNLPAEVAELLEPLPTPKFVEFDRQV